MRYGEKKPEDENLKLPELAEGFERHFYYLKIKMSDWDNWDKATQELMITAAFPGRSNKNIKLFANNDEYCVMRGYSDYKKDIKPLDSPPGN